MQCRWLVAGGAVISVLGGCGVVSEPEPTGAPSSELPSSNDVADDVVHERDDRHERDDLQVAPDPTGTTASYSTNGFDAGPTDAFFANLGTNRRTCSSCHLQDQGWTISAAKVRELAPDDPLFEPVDGSDCPPTHPGQLPDAARSTLLTQYGLIRIMIAVPDGADFSLVRASNPQRCAIPPASPALDGALFLFRRPLPTANLEFASTIMWDGRETLQKLTQGPDFTGNDPLLFNLEHQDDGANQSHEQATSSILGTSIVGDLFDFETSLYTAQRSVGSLRLDTRGAHGGPRYLGEVVAPRFFIGQNDPLAPGFTSRIFTLFEAWEPDARGRAHRHLTPAQEAIGRGERIFNTKTFTIANVAGLNSAKDDPLANPADPLFDTPFTGTCGTCHDSFDVGNHSTSLPLNIGVTLTRPTDDEGRSIAGILDVGHLPVYTLRAASGPTVRVTDPGRALISGHFVDAGKTKGPVLRALAARAPYFHNGSASDLDTVVRFYDARFDIGFTEEEERDLVAFLGAL